MFEAKLGQPMQQLQAPQIEGRLASYGGVQSYQMPGSGLPPVQMAKGVSDPEAANLAEHILSLRQQIYFTQEEFQAAREATEVHNAKMKHLENELEQSLQSFVSVARRSI